MAITITALGLVAAGVAIWNSVPPLCANSVLVDVPSPDRLRRAVVLERDCGATTDFSTQVSVLGYGQALPNDGGNAFVVGGRDPSVAVHWQDSRELRVRHDPKAQTFRKEGATDGVTIIDDPAA